MSFFVLIPFAVILLFSLIAFFMGQHLGKKHGKRLKQIEATPLVRGAEVAEHVGSMCKMHGRLIAPGGTLESPIEGLECIWFRLLVEEEHVRTERAPDGKTRKVREWVTILDSSKMMPCGIEDKDGAIEVSLAEAETLVKDGAKKESGFFTDVPQRLRKLVEEETGDKGNWFSDKKNLRIREQVLQVGEDALVVGKVKLIRTDRGVRPRFVKGQQPLLVTDKNDKELRDHFKWAVFWSNLSMWGGLIGGSVGGVGFVIVLIMATLHALGGGK